MSSPISDSTVLHFVDSFPDRFDSDIKVARLQLEDEFVKAKDSHIEFMQRRYTDEMGNCALDIYPERF